MGHDFSTFNLERRGLYYLATQVFIHPKYRGSKSHYDLALIKLKGSINTTRLGPIVENNICLPEEWTIEKDPDNEANDEYVMVSGWGGPTGLLKMAYWWIWDYKFPPWYDFPGFPNYTSNALLFRIDNQTACDVSYVCLQ